MAELFKFNDDLRYHNTFRCNLPTLTRRHVGIVRLKHPANMGHTCHEVRLFVLVLCPSKEVSVEYHILLTTLC